MYRYFVHIFHIVIINLILKYASINRTLLENIAKVEKRKKDVFTIFLLISKF